MKNERRVVVKIWNKDREWIAEITFSIEVPYPPDNITLGQREFQLYVTEDRRKTFNYIEI